MRKSQGLAIAVAAVLSATVAAAPSITSVLVTPNSSGTPISIGINGTGLCATTTVASCTGSNLPTVTLGGTALTVTATPTSVTANLPSVLSNGTYTLLLTAGTGNTTAYDLAIDVDSASTAGATGATGAAGARGATGPTGSAGAKGATGATGAAGTAGAKGATGATGPNGTATVTVGTTTTAIPGSNASVTNTGTNTAAILNFVIPTGAPGSIGPQGVQGLPGLPGANGLNGLNGLNGATGATGMTGPQGATGVAGATGSTGATGIGLNFRGLWSPTITYAVSDLVSWNGSGFIAVNPNANQNPTADVVGTYWNLLVGQGATGAQGLQGETGAVGPQGLQGPLGSTGAMGPPGPAGAQGLQGSPGLPGLIGPQGPSGAMGPAGPTGPAASNGYRGLWQSNSTYGEGDVVLVPQFDLAYPRWCMFAAAPMSVGELNVGFAPSLNSDPHTGRVWWIAMQPGCITTVANIPSNARFAWTPTLNSDGSVNWGNGAIVTAGLPTIDSTNRFSAGSVNSVHFDGGSQIDFAEPNLSFSGLDYQISFEFKTDGAQNPYSVMIDGLTSTEFGNGPAYGGLFHASGITVPLYVNDGVWHVVTLQVRNSTGLGTLTVDSTSLTGPVSQIGAGDFSTFRVGHIVGMWAGNWDNSFRGWIDDLIFSPL